MSDIFATKLCPILYLIVAAAFLFFFVSFSVFFVIFAFSSIRVMTAFFGNAT